MPAMPTFCGNEGIGKAMSNMVTIIIPKIEKVLTSLPQKINIAAMRQIYFRQCNVLLCHIARQC